VRSKIVIDKYNIGTSKYIYVFGIENSIRRLKGHNFLSIFSRILNSVLKPNLGNLD